MSQRRMRSTGSNQSFDEHASAALKDCKKGHTKRLVSRLASTHLLEDGLELCRPTSSSSSPMSCDSHAKGIATSLRRRVRSNRTSRASIQLQPIKRNVCSGSTKYEKGKNRRDKKSLPMKEEEVNAERQALFCSSALNTMRAAPIYRFPLFRTS